MKMRLDPRTSGEFARLRDIRMMKICERPILLERFEQCYSIFAQNSRNRKIEPTVVLPNNEESPCEMPLPTLW
ncbi:hypothetical protein TRFO_16597 [Tritrichomonas foetus]|uniref:Uncharacterized protein n=1 Tax=Tritrichomonas foetus TaxID=1144522 RepID=A0A1J4KPR0_9EUKA|nr:hypothetical protein TRFO_16597 [Tritrichomonas foetus]|eukprot:OHT13279.1 hypothetical protein TRFO_16597 [Tritrichomonas foetus]